MEILAMEQDDMKKCPYCAEMIKKEAVKCRWCGSTLNRREINLDFLSTPGYWHRVNKGKKVAGVCTGISQQLDSPILILPLRVFFILTTFFYAFGFILYIALWILMPAPIDPSSGGGKTPRTTGTEPVGESDAPSDNQDTGEKDSEEPEETPVKDEAKMVRNSYTVVLLAVATLLLFYVYIFLLKTLLGLTVSPALLFSGLIFGGFILMLAGMARHYKRIRIPLTEAQ